MGSYHCFLILLKIGALTSKVSAFKGRPWEIKYLGGVDIGDNLCCPLLLDLKGRSVVKASPTFNHGLNLEWVSDKARYIHESNNSRSRFSWPIYRSKPTKKFYTKILYSEYSKTLLKAWSTKSNNLSVVVNQSLDLNALFAFKEEARKVGADFVSENSSYLNKTFNREYSSTKRLNDLEKIEIGTFIGINPRAEASIANLIFRLRYLLGNFKSFFIGKAVDSTFSAQNYGSSVKTFSKSLDGKHHTNLDLYGLNSKLLTYGDSLSSRFDAISWIKLYDQLLGIPSHFIRLSTQVNAVGLDYLGCDRWSSVSSSLLVMPLDDKSYKRTYKKSTCIYTTHLASTIREADLLIPISSYLEKETAYLDFRGEYKRCGKVITPFFNAFNSPKEVLSHHLNARGKFVFWKKANIAKDINSLATNQTFQASLAFNTKTLAFKLVKSVIKTYLGDPYTPNCVLKTSPTLVQIKNFQEKQYFAFI